MTNDICRFTDLDAEVCDCSIHAVPLLSLPTKCPLAPTEPGEYPDVTNSAYHADKLSLSQSGAHHLLTTCPRQFAHDRDHPRVESEGYYDVGTAFHTLTLGTGPEIVVIDENDWKKAEARARRKKAWAEGKTPLLTAQYENVVEMSCAVREHDTAGTLLSDGHAEHSLYVRDPKTDVLLRCRPDWMTRINGRLVIIDLKSADSANPGAFEKAAANYGYPMQAAWYRALAAALGLDSNPAFLFIIVAKKPPHLVSVVEFDAAAMAYGDARARRAIDLYARCMETNDWPDYGTDVHLVGLPRWAYYEEENAA